MSVWITTWNDGSLKEEFQYYQHPETDRMIMDGWYNSYYKNGNRNATGRYEEGVKDGKWVLYYESGKV